MSETFKIILRLVQRGQVLVSEHDYDELVKDNIRIQDIVAGVNEGIAIEDYPEYSKGPCVLILQNDADGSPIHVVWGIPKGEESPAVIVTAYKPDPSKWSADFRRRKK